MFIEFGDPIPVLEGGSFWDYMETHLIDGYFQPPVSLKGLAQSMRANAMHSSALYAKRNLVSAAVELNPRLSREHFNRFLLDDLVFGNAYLQMVRNKLGAAKQIKHLPSLYMRRREQEDCFSYKTVNQTIDYKQGSVYQSMEYDPTQEIYGIPQYFATLSAVWLNEDATLFRRKYYKNGAHSGFLLFLNDPNMTKEQEREIQDKLSNAKGLGNFKNLFINGKGKSSEKPELIPVGQINAKDEFANIKNVSTGDILSAHRIPLDLMSIVREGFSSSVDLTKVDRLFYKNEIVPVVERLQGLNDWAEFEVVKLKEYQSFLEELSAS